MFRLLGYSDGGFRFSLGDSHAPAARFTVILGPNGTGKSQLLKSLADTYRLGDPAKIGPVSRVSAVPHPRRLLVLSNMVMDVFTNTAKHKDAYRYLGLRQASNNASTGALRDATIAAMLTCLRDPERADWLTPVLSALGADGYLVGFTSSTARKTRVAPLSEVERFVNNLEHTEDRSHYTAPEVLLEEVTRFQSLLTETIPLTHPDSDVMNEFWSLGRRFQIEPGDLVRLFRRLGLIDVQLLLQFGGRNVDLDELSTGQLFLLSTCARLAANVLQDSLILVDEPEVGLHPNWQSSWIPLVRRTVPDEFGCHLFVATHSPYLVSDADDVLVPGDEWGSFVEFQDPFQGRSIENILYRVFGARVVGNLMIEEDLTTVIEAISQSAEERDNSGRVRDALDRLERFSGADTEDLNFIITQASEVLR